MTPERFASGMTFAQYMTFIGTPENLAREAGWWRGPERMDWSGILRAWYERLRLRDDQVAAIRWLTAQPRGPARILVISEEWSSDCRRAVPRSPAWPRPAAWTCASSRGTAPGSAARLARIRPIRPAPIS
ncbi:MAG TPA: hypothetical protein VFE48_08630 [Methylomirabilota bacterium]|nr:hypothetical protein [Methylomirabilota bacterium]